MAHSAEPATSAEPGQTSVELCALSIRAGDQSLLEDVSVCFAAGQITLIIGRSGAGKSTLLRAIGGLIQPQDEELHVSGRVALQRPDTRASDLRGGVGVVFQDYALFDELTPLQNVRLAEAHRSRRRPVDSALRAEVLLRELGVPTNVRTAALSGGQRQRLAIARVLAYDPDVLLYDEPTSGLDSATASEVATLIKETHARHPRNSIIVTHDFAALMPIADAIYLIDPETRSLRRIERADWSQLHAMLKTSQTAPPDRPSVARPWLQSWAACAGHAVAMFFASTTRILETCAEIPWRLLPVWRSPVWGMRFLAHYLRTVAGPSAWLYVAIAGGIIGFVATYFTFRFLPSANYTKPLVIEDLLRSMGFALYRILVPILVTILIAARCGAAVASDIGGKQYGRQIDALRTLGAPPHRYLLTGVLYAFLVGTPWLLAIGYVVAAITSLVVFTATHPERGPWFWQLHFHRELVDSAGLVYRGSAWLLAKTTLCAAGIALIAYNLGTRPKDSSRAVSRGVTSTILWSTLFVLLVHFVFAFLEFE